MNGYYEQLNHELAMSQEHEDECHCIECDPPLVRRRFRKGHDEICKMDRIILFLTEERTKAHSQTEWQDLNDAVWVVRNVRRDMLKP